MANNNGNSGRLRCIASSMAVILTACATTKTPVPSVAQLLGDSIGQNGRACVRASDIRGYGVLERNLISIDGTSDYFLATVLPGCTDLAGSMGVMFSGRFAEICGQSMGRVITDDGACTIGHIYQFENRAAAFASYEAAQAQRRVLLEAAEERD